MQANELICPHCMYQAHLAAFENVGGGEMKCRRCRSKFRDPNAYEADIAYADCDSTRPVTRFPFSLSGKSAMIHVRDGYLAVLVRSNGQQEWIRERDYCVNDASDELQLYYICLSPRISWGVGSIKDFGAYGSAQLALSVGFVMRFCETESQTLAMEKYLKRIVHSHIADLIQTEIDRQSLSVLEDRSIYMGMKGTIEDGVSLVRIEPKGFRNSMGKTGSFPSYAKHTVTADPGGPLPSYTAPLEIIKQPKSAYVVKNGEEDVLCYGAPRMQRHKAGEKVETNQLHGVDRLIRYKAKEFEFPFGWGIYNQQQTGLGYYSAQGSISFYIDSTQRFSQLLYRTKNWQDFEYQFFTSVLKKELADAMREVMEIRVSRKDFRADQITRYLSAMSIDLTNFLNGEGIAGRDPAFRQYGLRVKQTDILSVNFYDSRR